jgi:hypothetical protein
MGLFINSLTRTSVVLVLQLMAHVNHPLPINVLALLAHLDKLATEAT